MQAKDDDGKYTLVLPPVAKLRDMQSMKISGELAAMFGQRVACDDKGRCTKWEEVRPNLLSAGKFKDNDMLKTLEMKCIDILKADAIIEWKNGAYEDNRGQPWSFPVDRRGFSKTGGMYHIYCISEHRLFRCAELCITAIMHVISVKSNAETSSERPRMYMITVRVLTMACICLTLRLRIAPFHIA